MPGKSGLVVDEFGQVTKLSIVLRYFDMPQYQIAALAGMPQPRLSEYSSGKRAIPMHHLIALSEVLKMEPEDLVGTISYESYKELFHTDFEYDHDEFVKEL